MSRQDPDIVKAKNEPGLYYVRALESEKTESWQVGERYVLEKVLGEGSFSCVCLATDMETQEKVAVKRIGDVLASIDNAKRVLRECAILRRLSHPNIVGLRDLFTKPSSTGRLVFRGGKLIPTSIDLYMVLEYCDQGDLFHLRGQLFETDVQFVMWQLLEVLRYIHACDVWHRDIKSANILISLQEGRRVAKLCDFGSARSAKLGATDTDVIMATAPSTGLADIPSPGKPQAGTAGRMTRPNSGINYVETDVMVRMDQEQEEQRQLMQQNDRQLAERLRSTNGGRSFSKPGDGEGGGDVGGGAMEGVTGPPAGPGVMHGNGGAAGVCVPGSLNSIFSTSRGHSLTCMLEQQQQQQLQAVEMASPTARAPDTDRPGPMSPPYRPAGGAGVVQMSDLFVRPSKRAQGGFDIPLTRAVCTPCYRAPEVVMSHGQYSSALDMWSLGCVFGELLQRVPYPGKSATPHLQVAPVISVTGMPLTPKQGERFQGPGNETTCTELAALFAVVGTPAWGTIDQVVQHPAWHAYLRQIPGRPSQLHRRFAMSGEAAVDLLSRLLEFDPSRRVTAEEAQQHAYFDSLKQQMQVWMLEEAEEEKEDLLSMMAADEPQLVTPSAILSPGVSEPGTQLLSATPGSGPYSPTMLQGLAPNLTNPGSPVSEGLGFDCWWRDVSMDPRHVEQVSKVLAGLEVELTRVCTVNTTGAGSGTGAASATSVVQQHLREMLEQECEEHHKTMTEMMRQLKEEAWAKAQSCAGVVPTCTPAPVAPEDATHVQPNSAKAALGSGTPFLSPRVPIISLNHFPSAPLASPLLSPGAGGWRGEGGSVAMTSTGGAAGVALPAAGELQARRQLLASRWGHRAYMYRRLGINRKQWALKPDPAAAMADPSMIGKERMPHHRDAEQAGILPEQHLRAGRHEEWVPTSLVDSLRAGGSDHAWGVSLAPPGMHESQMAPGMMDAIRQQHAR